MKYDPESSLSTSLLALESSPMPPKGSGDLREEGKRVHHEEWDLEVILSGL
jgi:hypothetical protein